MYEQIMQVRYSEVDASGQAGLPQIIDYFQDTSTFQSEEVGAGIAYLEQIHRAWLLAAWNIEIDRYPAFGERIRVVTAPYAFKSFFGHRNFGIVDEADRMIVRADSIWFWFDSEKGIPARPEPDIKQVYPLEERLEMNYSPRKITVPKSWEKGASFPVRKYHLDTNGHVNNGQYIRMAMEYVPDGFIVSKMRADYQRAAGYGDILVPEITREQNRIIVQLCGEEGTPYVIIEFTGRYGHD